MHWELWDTESGNLVEDFATEDEALHAVREILAVNRPDFIDFLALGVMYDEGESRDEELPPVLRGAELQSRLAEIAQNTATETSRRVHERIRKWLSEEGWDVRDVDDPQAIFNVMVALRENQLVNIYQRQNHLDHITIHACIILDDASLSALNPLSETVHREIAWKIYRDASLMGVDFETAGASLSEMRFQTLAYFDALTKDLLIQRIMLVIRSVTLSVFALVRSLEEAGRPPEAASNLRHLVPSISGPLTVAS